MPLITVIIPTRNRPEHLRLALQSLVNQTCADFSVVIADNSTDGRSHVVSGEFSDKLTLNYLSAGGALSMVENWNLGIPHTNGEYVAIMIDKTVWNPYAVEVIRNVHDHFGPVDTISWAHDYFLPISESSSAGHMMPRLIERRNAEEVSLRSQFEKRRQFSKARSAQSAHEYCLGKICFGAYSAKLIQRIIATYSELFHPIAPDYSSMTLASICSSRSIQLGIPLQVSRISNESNGTKAEGNAEYALRYLRSVDPSLSVLEQLPIPGVFQSIENLVAHDMLQFDRTTDLPTPNFQNLATLVLAELKTKRHVLPAKAVGEVQTEPHLMSPKWSLALQICWRFVAAMRRRLYAMRVIRLLASGIPKYRSCSFETIFAALDMQSALNSEWVAPLE